MKVNGKIKIKQDIQTFDSGFMKQVIVLTIKSGNYDNDVPIEFNGEKSVNLLKDFEEGQDCEIDINLRGSEYNGKWYSSIVGWKITATF